MISKRSIELFQKAAKEIPAYKKFLADNNCTPVDIRTAEDYAKVPLTSKKDYLQQYPLAETMWKEDWKGQIHYCSTSGSTGVPHYFPRNRKLAEQASFMVEEFLKNSSYGHGQTLVIMGFGMGVWIGGIFTMHAFEIAVERMKTPVALLPTGYNRSEVFKALKRLAPEYKQTIIAGYPPFIKEIVDDAQEEGVDLKKLNIRFMFAAEAFTEMFRDYVCEKAGVANPVLDTLNIYGSADIGAMAHETPLSILIRRLAQKEPLLFEDIFGQIEKTPTLAQYNPDFIEFETSEGQILLSGNSAVPLIRYAIGDHGGVKSFEDIEQIFKGRDISLHAEIKKAGIRVDKRPFVFVYERTDFSTNLHGINIFPEFIREGLANPSVSDKVTERFAMTTEYDDNQVQFLRVNVELQKKITPDEQLQEEVLDAIFEGLIGKSAEFAEVSGNRDGKELIKITLWENGHKKYFSPGTKQKWVEKTQY
jgi:phenylacetate-CoA ligase